MRRLVALCLCLLTLVSGAVAEELTAFAIRHGSRDEKRVCITIDDCYSIDHVKTAFEMSQRLDFPITFFPLGDQLFQRDAEIWQAIAASNCEIGSHTLHHHKLGTLPKLTMITHLLKMQENLDSVLGYHYGIVSLRPPYGNIDNKVGDPRGAERQIRKVGFEHIVLWDVSQTDPKKALKSIKNGSICLFHAKKKDLTCIETIVPELKAQGYELVTVREMLGFPEIETGPELYVYNIDDYR